MSIAGFAKENIALMFVYATSPVLRQIARHREGMPRFQRYIDGAGFQIRSDHYYEPTYSENDLPSDTSVERRLPGLDLNESGQLELISSLAFGDELKSIPLEKPSEAEFGYHNETYGFGDAEVHYSLIRLKKPKRIVEIGSGNSTLMAGLAVKANQRDDPDYVCERICVEPYEMAWLESTGVTVIRQRVETIDLSVFQALEADDMLFIDSSHVIRPWGDVLREFQEIVPSLNPGVLVHVHDVFTPRDYPEAWLRDRRRLWNEQYLLESFLAFNFQFEVVCALNWLKHHHWDAISRACPMLGNHPTANPGAFWFRRKLDS